MPSFVDAEEDDGDTQELEHEMLGLGIGLLIQLRAQHTGDENDENVDEGETCQQGMLQRGEQGLQGISEGGEEILYGIHVFSGSFLQNDGGKRIYTIIIPHFSKKRNGRTHFFRGKRKFSAQKTGREVPYVRKGRPAHRRTAPKGEGYPIGNESRGKRGSATAAAAEEEQDDDGDPDPVVVVEDVAQTVVHSEPPKYEVGEGRSRLHYHSMSKEQECAGNSEIFCRNGLDGSRKNL